MKNYICIDVDTDRKDKPFILSKPPEYQPSTPEEAALVIINDISCVCEALCRLIITADNSGYGNRDAMVKASIEHLSGILSNNSEKTSG